MTTKKYLKESIKLGGGELTVETGKVAKQADGSVVVRFGDTMILVTAVSARTAKEGMDFFPLTVEYKESTYAAGRIPGNYFRREGRPSVKEVPAVPFLLPLWEYARRTATCPAPPRRCKGQTQSRRAGLERSSFPMPARSRARAKPALHASAVAPMKPWQRAR